MKIDGRAFRTIWPSEDAASVVIIDQTRLPHRFETVTLSTVAEAAHAIRIMQVRGAPLMGATAPLGLSLALRDAPSGAGLARHCASRRDAANGREPQMGAR